MSDKRHRITKFIKKDKATSSEKLEKGWYIILKYKK